MIMSAFSLEPKNDLSEKLADDAMALTSAAFKTVKNVGSIIINGGEKKGDKAEGEKDGKK